jgi:DNA polymerase-3 subunit alpha
VKGKVDLRGRELQLRALEIREPDLGGAGPVPKTKGTLVVAVPAATCTNALIAKLKELLAAHPGSTPVTVQFLTSGGVTPLNVGSYRVEPAAGLLSELRVLLGRDAARLIEDASVVAIPGARAPAPVGG